MRVELGLRNGARGLGKLLRFADAVDREGAQPFAQVAVSVHEPVVAVVAEPLRRYDARGRAVALSAVVGHADLAPLERGARKDMEPLAGAVRGHAEHADAARGFAEAEAFVL